jgi:hypothetical protein
LSRAFEPRLVRKRQIRCSNRGMPIKTLASEHGWAHSAMRNRDPQDLNFGPLETDRDPLATDRNPEEPDRNPVAAEGNC